MGSKIKTILLRHSHSANIHCYHQKKILQSCYTLTLRLNFLHNFSDQLLAGTNT